MLTKVSVMMKIKMNMDTSINEDTDGVDESADR